MRSPVTQAAWSEARKSAPRAQCRRAGQSRPIGKLEAHRFRALGGDAERNEAFESSVGPGAMALTENALAGELNSERACDSVDRAL